MAAGVRIALENLICTPQKYQDEQFDLLFDRYSDDFLGFAWDSGHGALMCREDYYHFLKKYNDRLYATHLQDNESIGILDWDLIAKHLAKAPLELPADFEVCISGADEFEQLKRCHTQAEKFYRMVSDYRNSEG